MQGSGLAGVAGAQQCFSDLQHWVSKNTIKQPLTTDGGGFKTNEERPQGSWQKGDF